MINFITAETTVNDTNYEYETIIDTIVNKTQNDLIIALVLIMIGIAIVGIPLYRMRIKDRKECKDSESTEKTLLIAVVKDNTAAITALKTSVDVNNSNIIQMMQSINKTTDDTKENISVLIYKQDENCDKIGRLHDLTENVSSKVDKLNDNVNGFISRQNGNN